MAFRHTEAIEVLLSSEPVGVLALDPQGRRFYAFEYYPSWIRDGYAINPLYLPLASGTKTFDGLAEGTWYRLPPTIADALPDRFGNSLIESKLAEAGVTPDQITALDRLSYVADRAMGALEFRPARSLGRVGDDMLDLADLASAARDALHGSIAIDKDAKQALRQLLSVGTSAGGARAKAVINIDPLTQEITSGQRPAAGKESWLLKFDGVGKDKGLGDSLEYGRIEYAYSLMARDAGIDMPKTALLQENGRAHFLVKRFDRTDPGDGGVPVKVHMQSLCAMGHIDFNLLHTNDYASLFAIIERLGLGEDTATEAFRRMAFNYMAMNCDDHSKNFSFLMDAFGNWHLAPAYDVTFAYNSQNEWLRQHLMGVDGKFDDVSKNDLLNFAERHGVAYAKKTVQNIRGALGNWPDYAKRAGLGKHTIDEIANYFTNL